MPITKDEMISVIRKVRAKHPHAVVTVFAPSAKTCRRCRRALVQATYEEENGQTWLQRLWPVKKGPQTMLVCPNCPIS